MGRANIKCYACKPAAKSCNICGGYKVIFVWTKCPTCHHFRLERPGVMTTYEGKVYASVDGIAVTCHMSKPWTCSMCPSAPSK